MKSNGNGKSATAGKSNNKKAEKQNTGVTSEQLQDFFEDGLKDLYWAEKKLVKSIPKMIKNASSPELVDALKSHLQETEGQVQRLEDVFASIDTKPVAKKCDAMEGLVKEAEGIMEECDPGGMMDAGIIAAAQKVEHYEIASYGTLAAYAGILGHVEAVSLLNQTLEEEKAADDKLTEVTGSAVQLMEMENAEH